MVCHPKVEGCCCEHVAPRHVKPESSQFAHAAPPIPHVMSSDPLGG
jgi:hypothetical protein